MRSSKHILESLDLYMNSRIRADRVVPSMGAIVFRDDPKVLRRMVMGISSPVVGKTYEVNNQYFVDFYVAGNPHKFRVTMEKAAQEGMLTLRNYSRIRE